MNDDPSSEAYYLALGRFIDHFAGIEQAFHSYLWIETAVDISVLKAILPDTRIGNVSSAIRKIWLSKGKEPPALFERAIQQAGILQSMRNNICHVRGGLTDKGLVISNMEIALPGKGVERVVTIQDLNDASHDLRIIGACLAALSSEATHLPPSATLLPWDKIALTPWRYKPPQQRSKDRKDQKPPRGQRRQPTS
ncbi:hypothetical protein [Sphingomonas crocodyli]|uniref:Uncharacterized protein n=1 Tax=Sphingomonas crocodyli TaxID=1979270 RepID=A0A437LV51_9SPHN|nr:hypothetical protein [Sphingomonas crocodyli]RVT89236.1 hypothetical protein EOD43_23290 [Sphingomonas crocodyli]